MWRIRAYLILLSILSISILFFTGQGRGEEVEVSGFVKVDKRIDISDGVSNGDTYGKLRLEAKYDPTADLFFFAGLELRYYDFPVLEDLPPVDELESDYPVDLLPWETYVELNQFIWDNLDLKIGKQRIAWGKADKFNPTDNLNPNDLTDFLDFEAKIPSLALNANYYLGDYTITGVWLPLFEPALFPRGGTASLLGRCRTG